MTTLKIWITNKKMKKRIEINGNKKWYKIMEILWKNSESTEKNQWHKIKIQNSMKKNQQK